MSAIVLIIFPSWFYLLAFLFVWSDVLLSIDMWNTVNHALSVASKGVRYIVVNCSVTCVRLGIHHGD